LRSATGVSIGRLSNVPEALRQDDDEVISTDYPVSCHVGLSPHKGHDPNGDGRDEVLAGVDSRQEDDYGDDIVEQQVRVCFGGYAIDVDGPGELLVGVPDSVLGAADAGAVCAW
jgi:hypothetical protein